MPRRGSIATLIGDIVASRRHPDRRGLQRALIATLDDVNNRLRPLQPLALTIGDEFQGAFASVADAVLASLLVRLKLLESPQRTDSRYGLGFGPVTVFDPLRRPTSQDGPGWWSAREAIDRAKRLADAPRTSFARTCFDDRSESTELTPLTGAPVQAFLLCRDAIVDQMNARQRRLLLGALSGQTQAELASHEAITQSAVSQSLRHSGAFAIEAAHASLRPEALT